MNILTQAYNEMMVKLKKKWRCFIDHEDGKMVIIKLGIPSLILVYLIWYMGTHHNLFI